jgi:hypothetical protein
METEKKYVRSLGLKFSLWMDEREWSYSYMLAQDNFNFKMFTENLGGHL